MSRPSTRSVITSIRSSSLGLGLCLRGEQGVAAAPAATRDPPVGALVFGSDQGLVGRFNEVVGSFALEGLRKLPAPKTVWAVGERVCSCLEEAGLAITKRFAVPGSVTAITALVTEIQIEIETHTIARERNSEVHVFHNSPRAAAHYGAAHQRLLPLDVAWRRRLTKIPWPDTQLAQVLGGGTASLTALVHEHLFISLYRTCAESLASENASRLEAMQRAEKNTSRAFPTICGTRSIGCGRARSTRSSSTWWRDSMRSPEGGTPRTALTGTRSHIRHV